MKRRTDFIVGLTGVVGMACLAAVLILFGELRWNDDTTYPLTLAMDDAAGLTPGGLVTLNGVPIGTIETLTTAADPRDGVRVQLAITQGQPVPRAVDVFVSRDLVGNTTLALNATPTTEGPEGTVEPGDTLDVNAQDLIGRLAGLLDERLTPLGDSADSVRQLADTYTRVGEKLENMLDPAPEQPADGEPAPPNLFRTVAEIEAAAREARVWLADEQLRERVGETVARAESALAEVETAAQQFAETSQSIEAEAQTIAARTDTAITEFTNTARQLESALTEVQTLVAAINQGEGTAGMLVNNPDLYRNINNASIRLEQMLKEATLFIRKYRTEGIEINL